MAVHMPPAKPPMNQDQKELLLFLEKVMAHGKIKSYEVVKKNAVNDVPYFHLEMEGIFDPNL